MEMVAVLNEKQKSLNMIMSKHKNFPYVIDSFIDTLKKKNAWKIIENNIDNLKNKISDQNKKKLIEWERYAYSLYSKSQSKTLELIKLVSDNINKEELLEIENWIKNNSYSKIACNKNQLSIDDNISTIKAKIIHLIFMAKSSKPINISDIIYKSE